MRFPPSLLDEIRARLPVSDVVGRRVKLRRQGREFIGLSPFNAEKTPSFTVNDQKGFYHCFSSGRHGDIFRFLMETEGLAFPEAVERLAAEAGVALPSPDPASVERDRQRDGLHDVLEAAAAYFEAGLNGPQGREARAYVASRGLGEDMVRRFRIGYAPPARYGLKEHLGRLGIAREAIERAGLLVTGSDIAVPFDRFRDRLMFPITDLRGRVIAFGGRALQPDQMPKYSNSPETELFHKGSVLFNLAAARQAAREAGTVIVAEGYMDVIALTRAGYANAVAPLGTALTADQLGLLWRVADEPILCFDGDKAGLRAANRAVDLALPLLTPGKSLRFALLPEGQDPDDLVRAGGQAVLEQALALARPLSDMLWAREVESSPLDTPERRAAFEGRLARTLAVIGEARVRKHYEDQFRERLAGLFGRDGRQRAGRRRRSGGWSDRGGARRAGAAGAASPSAALVRSLSSGQALPRREAVLLLALVNHPALIPERAETLCGLDLSSAELDALRSALLDLAADDVDDAATARARLEAGPLGDLVGRIERMWSAGGRAEWWLAPEAAAIDVSRAWDHTAALHHKLVTLHRELKTAEMALQAEPSDENLARLFDIQSQLSNADGTEALMEGFGQASGRPVRAF